MNAHDGSTPLASLDYHAQAPPPRFPLVDASTLALSALIATIVTTGVFILIPRMLPVFYDFGCKLPTNTAAALRFGERFGVRGVALILLLAAVPPPLSTPRGGKGRRTLRRATFLLLGLTLAWAINSIAAPYVR